MVLRHLRLLLFGPEQSHRRQKELLESKGRRGAWGLGYLSYVKYGVGVG